MENIFGKKPGNKSQDAAEHWISVSDLMSGLMMVFLFISVAFMRHVMIERDKIKQVAVAYQENQVDLYNRLQKEFSKDLAKWNAEIDKNTLSFQFKSPDILFANGSSELNLQFKAVLNDFFPRYMAVLGGFKASINEVRIEGHTSSHWSFDASPEEAYFRNMELSQARTRSVLFYVQNLPKIRTDREWVKRNIAAVGLSSSKPILNKQGKEDAERSRRVTFRVITNAETEIRRFIQD
ncbi:OmpA family protein [Laribacter hongkongensis]|uniref:OmpA/MotB family protein n=1 Tax=Laribacter hongkongensis TaxID=168471 RepID=UPI001EFEE6C4|nr:OmpA family protein [Laribacter hongkongensis]MCG9115326.1 OmpA family protein [Laribacter hongkongensis]